jgi:hypothetical protein
METEDIREFPNLSFVGKSKELHVQGTDPVDPDEHQHGDKKKKRHEPSLQSETVDRFDELARAAEQSNAILVRNHSPYRFCIYRKGAEIFIDIVTLDKDGKIGAIQMHNITHEDFSKWIRHVQEREGLFFDQTG